MQFRDENKKHHNQLLEGLKLMRECPMCKNEYKIERFSVLDEYHGAHLVHIVCPKCANSILALVTISQFGMSSVGMATDLSAEDAKKIFQLDAITDDDVLDFHTMLKNIQTHIFVSKKVFPPSSEHPVRS
ncbi:MAG: hypothetical protein COX81_02945 [Candidatus Magasanikbacteria bacterium CG_4_10_14_0_2_um_filter_37_12]|uniref:Uncharacterized protein n=1 Tax=Candidatus Magasanikbacteria bacterium CG_4_10_14_0_2_um_filter_37_12 TaxID=1974637 RepID=A0A2M7V7F2_9BACT|nr:MAG: hypothetical protein COX81_02945 [Candidatus Magasanikbacteria bacterium CG_4_10_14_0_2_um_filter_37_12]